ncbi:hypothetical protein J2Z35_000822 [Acetoanaerobium pronyense]|uniref:Phospholipase C/D domain-containing protein n=1 Tax=Acetoanaerobium pronyense TaxID=1482736 RepID=A0ABS4KI31_9FIRM|nr:zinc dependent phospholipase C family protein [Acetoanaerobium pronyense]MBP2027030.1 hypothetical protein [Acetoanaerobium pronyense]
MLIPTHRIIAHNVFKNVNSNMNFKLNRPMLSYGSMKPDIAPSLKSKKHYKEPTLDFVIDEIIKLMEIGISEDLISINKFSVKLGVITHFLSDFFCLPHHDRDYFSDKLTEHMIYEKNLHYKFKEFAGLEKIKMPSLMGLEKEDIRSFIDELHYEYSTSPMGYENDIKGSINVSSAISMIIIENSAIYQPELVTI